MTSPRFNPESAALLAGSTLLTTTPVALAGNPSCRAVRAVTLSTVIPCSASSLLFSGCSFLAVSLGLHAGAQTGGGATVLPVADGKVRHSAGRHHHRPAGLPVRHRRRQLYRRGGGDHRRHTAGEEIGRASWRER